jgi:hypothetical protein
VTARRTTAQAKETAAKLEGEIASLRSAETGAEVLVAMAALDRMTRGMIAPPATGPIALLDLAAVT